jgi:hypothetical protein
MCRLTVLVPGMTITEAFRPKVRRCEWRRRWANTRPTRDRWARCACTWKQSELKRLASNPKALLVAVLDARERLAHRREPLPERIAAQDLRITAKLKELEAREPQPAADSPCNVHLAIAEAAYELADETNLFDELEFWHDLADSAVTSYIECELGI